MFLLALTHQKSPSFAGKAEARFGYEMFPGYLPYARKSLRFRLTKLIVQVVDVIQQSLSVGLRKQERTVLVVVVVVVLTLTHGL